MTHRGPFQPLTFCDSVTSCRAKSFSERDFSERLLNGSISSHVWVPSLSWFLSRNTFIRDKIMNIEWGKGSLQAKTVLAAHGKVLAAGVTSVRRGQVDTAGSSQLQQTKLRAQLSLPAKTTAWKPASERAENTRHWGEERTTAGTRRRCGMAEQDLPWRDRSLWMSQGWSRHPSEGHTPEHRTRVSRRSSRHTATPRPLCHPRLVEGTEGALSQQQEGQERCWSEAEPGNEGGQVL